MKDLAMVIHFRTRSRGAVPGAPEGGYAWVYGRFDDFSAFEAEVTHHFRRQFRFDVVACEDKRQIFGRPDDPVEASLVAELGRFPIRYHTVQFYNEEAVAAE